MEPNTAALPRPCSPASHEALKRSPAWAELPYVGRMVTPADEVGPEEVLILRNCRVCHSTIAVLEIAS